MKDFVLKCYNDYKIYVDLDDSIMPKLNPVILEKEYDIHGKHPLAYVNSDEILSPVVNLYINPLLKDYNERFQIAKLFHEFTHILDGNTLFKDYSEKDFMHLMSTYSEYHASQIEVAYNIGFKNIHSFRKINLDKTFVFYENNKIKINEDYLHPMADALCIIDKSVNAYFELDVVEYYRNYSAFETKTMYYLGKRKFCDKFSLKRIPNITANNYGQFYPYIKKIEQCIEIKDYQNLISARKELWKFYTSYFSCKESFILPTEP